MTASSAMGWEEGWSSARGTRPPPPPSRDDAGGWVGCQPAHVLRCANGWLTGRRRINVTMTKFCRYRILSHGIQLVMSLNPPSTRLRQKLNRLIHKMAPTLLSLRWGELSEACTLRKSSRELACPAHSLSAAAATAPEPRSCTRLPLNSTSSMGYFWRRASSGAAPPLQHCEQQQQHALCGRVGRVSTPRVCAVFFGNPTRA